MRHLRTASIVLMICASALAADEKPNAADLYKQAYARLDAMPPDVVAAFYENEGRITEPLSPAQAKIAETTGDIARLIARAKAIEACDWKTVIKNPWDAGNVSELGHSRRAARLMVIRATHLRSQGREKESIEELLSGWALGRRVGYGQLKIGVLVQASIDGMMTEELARLAPSLSKDGRVQLVAGLAKLPAARTMADAARFEHGVVCAFLRGAFFDDIKGNVEMFLEVGKTEHKMGAIFKAAQGEEVKEEPFDEAPYKSMRTIAEKDPVLFKSLVDSIEASLTKYCELYDMPIGEREAFRAKWSAGLDRSNPLLSLVIVQADSFTAGLSDISRRDSSINAMLLAGLAYLDEGDRARTKIVEPGSKERFDLEKTATGFILRSRTIKMGDEFVSLRFGPEPREKPM